MGIANERREGCDGCDRTVVLAKLQAVSMPDGNTFACCPRCAPHARNAAEKIEELDAKIATCEGCRSTFRTDDIDDVVLTDGTVLSICVDCLEDIPGRGWGPDEVTGEPAETTEIARRKTLCSQCHEWFDEELYRVDLLDGRTEELCSGCRRVAEANGIVTDVRMREAEALEILDLEPGADESTIRRAFLTQVKRAHPDQSSGSKRAFRLVKEAYDRLR